jgi:hypothetical protein
MFFSFINKKKRNKKKRRPCALIRLGRISLAGLFSRRCQKFVPL